MRNTLPFVFTITLLFFTFSSCSNKTTEENNINPDEQFSTSPNTLFFGGKIYAADDDFKIYEAMLVKDGVIEFVGTKEEAMSRSTDQTTSIDLKGKAILPGFIGTNFDLLKSNNSFFDFKLQNTRFASLYKDDVQKAFNENRSKEWLVGYGLNFKSILDFGRDPKIILDEVSTSQKIVLVDETHSVALVNSAVLEAFNLQAINKEIKGGQIGKTFNNVANGLLFDGAAQYVLNQYYKSISDYETKLQIHLKENIMPKLYAFGYTSLSANHSNIDRGDLRIWNSLNQESNLKMAVHLGLSFDHNQEYDEQIQKLSRSFNYKIGENVIVNQVNINADGEIKLGTAKISQNYKIGIFSPEVSSGLMYANSELIRKITSTLEPFGYNINVKASGEDAISAAVNGLKASTAKAGSHRISGARFISDEQLDTFANFRLAFDVQILNELSLPINQIEPRDLIVSNSENKPAPINSILSKGVVLSLSNDWVSDLKSPIQLIEEAVTRTIEPIALEDAIRSVTLNAAKVIGRNAFSGTLTSGKEANFIILSEDPFTVPKNELGSIFVETTYYKGQTSFQK